MSDPWYKTAFGSQYSDLYSHRNDQDAHDAIDFLHRHHDLDPRRGRALDLCCGSGRHLFQWINHQGDHVVGLDLSPNLLDEAAELARSAGRPFALVRADMRRLPFRPRSFRVVMNLFTSFGYFHDEAENENVFAEVARVLVDVGGHFVFDHINPPALRRNLKGDTVRTTEGGACVRERRGINEGKRRVEKQVEMESPTAKHSYTESVRFYEKEEVVAMGERHGLRLEAAYGGFDDSPLTDEAGRALYVFHT